MIVPIPDDHSVREIDKQFIRRCYEIARNAVSKGNHPFGALLAYEGEIIVEAENMVETSKDITQHAEMGVISYGSQKIDTEILQKCTLYTSTEPCIMCCGAILKAGIHHVVYGTSDSQMAKLIFGSYLGIPSKNLFAMLKPTVTIIGPVLEEDGLKIHKEFWPQKITTCTRPDQTLS